MRLRLARGEVDVFARDGRVEDAVRFGPSARLAYALERATDATAVTARFGADGVVVRVPAAVAARWCRDDEVGFEGEQDAGDGATLRILVEKDFTCLKTRSGEDESDAFPNPHDHC